MDCLFYVNILEWGVFMNSVWISPLIWIIITALSIISAFFYYHFLIEYIGIEVAPVSPQPSGDIYW